MLAHCTFTDLEFGSKRNALHAARDWRDATAALHDKPSERQHNYKKIKTNVRSNTGVLGVSLVDYFSKSRQRRMCYYAAQWSETVPGKVKRKTCCKQFGFDPYDDYSRQWAFKCAKRHRKRMEKEHYL